MRLPGPLVLGRFLRRYQRFMADFRLKDGSVVTAHCANPGSMATCLEVGAPAWLSPAAASGRRLRYTWQIAAVGRARIFVNPVMVNAIVAEAVEGGQVPELDGYASLAREVRFGEHTRFDLRLSRGRRACYVEVKSATLRLAPGLAGFPDSITARGRRHLEDLARVVSGGDRGVQLFVVARSDARAVTTADAIDAEYGEEMRRAIAAGVEVIAYRLRFARGAVALGARVPFRPGPPSPRVETSRNVATAATAARSHGTPGTPLAPFFEPEAAGLAERHRAR